MGVVQVGGEVGKSVRFGSGSPWDNYELNIMFMSLADKMKPFGVKTFGTNCEYIKYTVAKKKLTFTERIRKSVEQDGRTKYIQTRSNTYI